MKDKYKYKPRKIVPIQNGGSYILNKTEYLIVEKEYNVSSDLLPKFDLYGKYEYQPCIKKELLNLSVIEKRKKKIKKLKNIIEKLKMKLENILKLLPIEQWNSMENFEIDRLYYYYFTRKKSAEILLESISSSIKN